VELERVLYARAHRSAAALARVAVLAPDSTSCRRFVDDRLSSGLGSAALGVRRFGGSAAGGSAIRGSALGGRRSAVRRSAVLVARRG